MTDAAPSPGIELTAIGKSYGRQAVLADIALRFVPGRIYALCGLNGSGKSTLIKILTGVIAPDPGGSIRIGDEMHRALTPAIAHAAGIEAIYQDLALFPNLSVADNVAFRAIAARPLAARHPRQARDLARRTLSRLGVAIAPRAAVETLSIAERQIVAIARALAASARFLILDEPTASLTGREVDRLLALVRDLAASGVTILFVSHRHEEVARLADEIVVLRDGRLVARHGVADLTRDGLALAMAGRVPEPPAPHATMDQRPILVETRALSRPGEFEAVDLAVRGGEVVGITGLLGAGRTELALTLFGMRRPAAGAILVGGRPVAFRSNRDAIAAGIAYVSEDRLGLGLVLGASIADNIAMASRRRLVGPGRRIDRAATAALVERLVRELEIKAPDVAAPVSTLSGGNQQRVAIAKWLATEPSLLILDSPTVGVDVTARAAIYRLVRRLAAAGVSIILISDEVEEILAAATVVHVMRAGRLSAPLDPAGLSEHDLSERIHG